VVGADHPNGAVRLEDAAAFAEPGAGETIVVGKAGKLVPGIVDAVDHRVVGAEQLAFQLQIVGRIGEHEVDALVGEPRQLLQAIADEDAVDGQGRADAVTQGHGTQLSGDATQPAL